MLGASNLALVNHELLEKKIFCGDRELKKFPLVPKCIYFQYYTETTVLVKLTRDPNNSRYTHSVSPSLCRCVVALTQELGKTMGIWVPWPGLVWPRVWNTISHYALEAGKTSEYGKRTL